LLLSFGINLFECLVDLSYFNGLQRFHLMGTNSIPVEDHTLWVAAVHLVKVVQGFCHQIFKVQANFLADGWLHGTLRPVLGC
jgi:hypothetical protein